MADYSFDTHLSGSVNSDVAADVTLGGLDNVKVDSSLDSTSQVAVTGEGKVATDSKVKTDSAVSTDSKVATTSNVDLAPVAVDSCVRVEIGSLPPTQIVTPWEQRFGLSILGVELVAWTVGGRTATTVMPATPPPRIVWSVEHGEVVHRHDDHHAPGSHGDHGLHIRLG